MHIKWRGLELPSAVYPDQHTLSPTFGKFVAEPFERGFGTTVGNSLRRVLLSSLEGSAVTQIKIRGAQHEFTTIPGVLEDVTDITGDVIGGLLGKMGGLVAGPVMDGGVNAMMTLKLGYLAKRRCRSFKGWSAKQAKSISAEALKDVKEESGSVVTDLLKGVGGLTSHAARATEKALAGSKSAWGLVQSWFGGKPAGV